VGGQGSESLVIAPVIALEIVWGSFYGLGCSWGSVRSLEGLIASINEKKTLFKIRDRVLLRLGEHHVRER
jgi:hypothetical protein